MHLTTFVLIAALATLILVNAEPAHRALAFADAAVTHAGDFLDGLHSRVLAAVGIANAQANSILDALARGVDYPGNAAVYVKLHTGDPGSAGTSNAAGNTTRQQATFAAAASGANATNADVVWTNVNTAETYSHVSFWTASSAGTFLGSSALTASKLVAIGDTFTIPSGSLTMALTPLAA